MIVKCNLSYGALSLYLVSTFVTVHCFFSPGTEEGMAGKTETLFSERSDGESGFPNQRDLLRYF